MIRRLLLLATLLLTALPALAAASRDPLAPVLDMPQPPVATVPGDLFLPEQMDAMTGIVNEARDFGVPLAVRVITMRASPATLANTLALDDAAPTGQEIVQQMANAWLAHDPLETSPGAADGILLFVVVAEDDHTGTMAAFATGKNALPLNGLTRQSLDDVLNRAILPFFRNGTIADGIRTGIAMLSYDNLFARPARLERTHQQETLFTVTNTALFGITVAAPLGLVALAWWIGNRQRVPAGGTVESPYEAGAILRGRVDEAVVAGALVHLVQIGALIPDGDRLRLASPPPLADPFERDILDRLAREAIAEGLVPEAAFRRVQDLLTPARRSLENRLARKGLLNAKARVESLWLVLASVLVAAIALMALVPSIVSLSRAGLGGILIAVLTIAGVLAWTAKRSWTTPAGRQAVREWQDRPPGEDERRIVDMIVNQDAVLDTPGGPDVQPITRLVRDVRGYGAG